MSERNNQNKDYILKVSNLKQYFPVGKSMFGKPAGYLRAVDGVTFNLERGKTIGIVGESGCGKTTLGRTILRLYDITEGSAVYVEQDGFEHELATIKRKDLQPLRTHLQYVFQDPYYSDNLPLISHNKDHLPVHHQIEFPLKIAANYLFYTPEADQ